MHEADGRDDVDVLILTGADPAFCAGLDLKELGIVRRQPRRRQRVGRLAQHDRRPRARSRSSIKPLIGAINGVAITGGFELALNCDFLIASEHAKFGDTHTRVGVMPGWGLTVLLPQAIGVRRAREMSFTGNFLSAEEALQFGLVNHVVAHDDLIPFTRSIATDIIGNDQDGVRQIRGHVRGDHPRRRRLGAGGARLPDVAAHDVQPGEGGGTAGGDPGARQDAVTTTGNAVVASPSDPAAAAPRRERPRPSAGPIALGVVVVVGAHPRRQPAPQRPQPGRRLRPLPAPGPQHLRRRHGPGRRRQPLRRPQLRLRLQPDRLPVGLPAPAVAVRQAVGPRLRPAEARRGRLLLHLDRARPRHRAPAGRALRGHRRSPPCWRRRRCCSPTPTSCCRSTRTRWSSRVWIWWLDRMLRRQPADRRRHPPARRRSGCSARPPTTSAARASS